KLENQAQDLQQHVEEDEDMNAVDETIEESADYDGATLEREWDPFREEEQINNAGIPSNQCSRNTV
ncbi:Hypothetical predicted protein, partial [Paramuricea clavata]